MRRAFLQCALLAATMLLVTLTQAQNYPNRPIRIVVPFGAGGPVDHATRLVSDKLRQRLGQPIVVDNRAGGGGNIGAEAVFNAPPDGYTLLWGTPGPLVINKLLYSKLNYDPEKFTPVSLLTMSPNALVVNPKVAESLQQLIAIAKANPDKLSYASSGIGATTHLAGESLKMMTGTKIVHVPYKAVPAILMDLIAGRVDMLFMTLEGTLSHIRAGSLRVLAVGSPKRNPLLPDVPAMDEILPGFLSTTWSGLVAPPGTPPAIVNKLSAVFADVMNLPEFTKSLGDLGTVVIGGSPAELMAMMKKEADYSGNVIRVTGAKAD